MQAIQYPHQWILVVSITIATRNRDCGVRQGDHVSMIWRARWDLIYVGKASRDSFQQVIDNGRFCEDMFKFLVSTSTP